MQQTDATTAAARSTAALVAAVERGRQKVDIDHVLAMADRMLKAGEDPWNLLTDAAACEESDADLHRWNQCDLAAKVVKQYGADSVAKFATDANIPVRRAREYRTLGLHYQRSARAEYLAQHDTLTYSHLRAAARLDNEDISYHFLDRAAKRGWSCDKTEYVIARWRRYTGRSRPRTGTKPLVDAAACRIMGTHARQVFFEFADEAIVLKLRKLWQTNQGADLIMILNKLEVA